MHKKTILILVLATILTIAAAAPVRAQDSTVHRGKVTTTMDSGGYTYVEFEENGKRFWAAGPVTKVAVGDTIEISGAMPMQDFTSKTLKRTFAFIYFAGSIANVGAAGGAAVAKTGSGSGLPEGHVQIPIKDIPAPAATVKAGSVAKAEGGQTVAECYAQKKALNGKTVKVRGRVVKFMAEIMGKNWLHVQDGTGAGEDGTNDLTVTTAQAAAAGDLVLVTGTLVAGKDFGSGYSYAVLVENAALKIEEKAAKPPVKTP